MRDSASKQTNHPMDQIREIHNPTSSSNAQVEYSKDCEILVKFRVQGHKLTERSIPKS